MRPKFAFGDWLTDAHGFTGQVKAMFENLPAAVNCGIVGPGWWEKQVKRPSTQHQVFYSISGRGGFGAVLLGEREARLRRKAR